MNCFISFPVKQHYTKCLFLSLNFITFWQTVYVCSFYFQRFLYQKKLFTYHRLYLSSKASFLIFYARSLSNKKDGPLSLKELQKFLLTMAWGHLLINLWVISSSYECLVFMYILSSLGQKKNINTNVIKRKVARKKKVKYGTSDLCRTTACPLIGS